MTVLKWKLGKNGQMPHDTDFDYDELNCWSRLRLSQHEFQFPNPIVPASEPQKVFLTFVALFSLKLL